MSTDQLVHQARVAATRGAAFGAVLRPDAARLPVLVLLAAAVRTRPGAPHVLAGVVLVVAAYGLAAAYNDLHDVDVDRANHRGLPLVTGILSPDDLRRAIGGCAVAVAGSQALLHQPRGVVVTVVALALSTAYSHPRSAVARRGVWATALLAVTYVGLPVVLAGPPPAWPRVAAALLAVMAMLLYKDVKDEPGDRAHGKRTPLVRWGLARVDAVATGLLLAATLLAVPVDPAWPAAVLAGSVLAQRRMVALGARSGRPLLVFQCFVVVGAMALAGV